MLRGFLCQLRGSLLFLSLRIAGLEDIGQAYVDDHDEYEQHQTDGKQHLSVQAGRVAHLADDGRGQETDRVERKREVDRASGYQGDGHGLADGPSHTQHDGGHDTGLRGGDHHLENGLDMGRSQRQGGGFILGRNRLQGGFADVDHGGKDHDGQHDHGGDQVRAAGELVGLGAFENRQLQLIHQGVQDHDAQQAVNHGRDSGQKLHGGLDDGRQLLRRHLRQEYGGEDADRHADQDRQKGPDNACKDDEEDAEGRLLSRRLPYGSEKDLSQTHLKNGGRSVYDHI